VPADLQGLATLVESARGEEKSGLGLVKGSGATRDMGKMRVARRKLGNQACRIGR
jgi:hypothetical protein